jgi:hypothetical protein
MSGKQGDKMKTKLFGLTALALVTSACGQGNLYPLPQDQAYAKLIEAKIVPSNKPPFGKLNIVAGGDGTSTVRWSVNGMKMCEANIAAEGADKSRINAFCDGGGEGAAAGIMQNMYRNGIIELIDAALRGREFDPRLASGSTAASWPKDSRQADASLGGAATEALKMERDMKKMIKEGEAQQATDDAAAARRLEEAKAHEGVTFKPGQPMVDVSN